MDLPPGAPDATVRNDRVRRPVEPVALRCGVCGHALIASNLPCPNCGAESAIDGEVQALVVGGTYRVESELGRGAMGVVYLAKDTSLGRRVALKMIEPAWAAESPDAVASFYREARALASIHTQYVVQVYAFGVHAGSHFFAMEYVRGSTLKQILAEHREHGDPIPVHRTVTILSRVAEGIDAVHAAGIVHRDVKPGNIVIEEHTGRPVLLDFGLAVHSTDPAAAQAAGTPQYMAPEQAGAAVVQATITERTDVYALGVTAFEMLAGVLPFTSTDRAQLLRQHARKAPPALSSIRRGLAPFDAVVARALAKDPDERYPSCAAFAAELEKAGERWSKSMLPTLPPPEPSGAPSNDWLSLSLPQGTVTPSFGLRLGDLRSPEPPVEHGRPYRALVVDDSPVFRKFTVKATEMAFYRVHRGATVVVEGAGSGSDAVISASKSPPDLVLLDFDMPGLDGLGTLSRLRALPGGDRARVVVVSGRVRPDDRWRFEVLGVSDFVSKPIDFRQLVDRIEGIARRYDEQDREPRSPHDR